MFLSRRKSSIVVAKSVRSKDPLHEFKKASRKEFSRYDIPGEVWKSVRRLLYVAIALALFWFLRECYLSWNIFQ